MKKLLSILLFFIYLFNLVGYSFYYRYCIELSDKKIVQQIEDNDYNENELIEIKIPVNLPYYNNFNKFERVDGEIVINNTHYNYVKRKISNDTLYLMCIPNIAKTLLYKEKTYYANLGNDLPANNKGNNPAKKNSFSEEYTGLVIKYIISTPVVTTETGYGGQVSRLFQGHCTIKDRPPQLTA